jgi:hypothetical protein
VQRFIRLLRRLERADPLVPVQSPWHSIGVSSRRSRARASRSNRFIRAVISFREPALAAATLHVSCGSSIEVVQFDLRA